MADGPRLPAVEVVARAERVRDMIRVASQALAAGEDVDLGPIEDAVRGVCDAAMAGTEEGPGAEEAVAAVEDLISELDRLEEALHAHGRPPQSLPPQGGL
ncbi:MAG: hypothetical protein ACPGNT_05150 [Rhodospirillales bacterium]